MYINIDSLTCRHFNKVLELVDNSVFFEFEFELVYDVELRSFKISI